MKSIIKIKGTLKNYEWGKIGYDSFVAQLQKSAFNDFVVENIPYSELWMGTHCSGPSFIPSEKEMKLLNWIHSYPTSLGENITNSYDVSSGLPFLFKVLSVKKALSIQVHPDKTAAVILHKQYPEHYPDDNHKPEMAIALTEFEALCGFRPLQEIKDFLLEVPQLNTLVGDEIFKNFIKFPAEDNLKQLFTALMTCPFSIFQPALIELIESFKKNILKSHLCESIQDLFLRVSSQYPDDIGCFCLFFLNYIKLKPGEAIFLAANEPHAYLLGDCIECMACSDNVVRAGLTPKFKDIQTLCDMLTYKCKSGNENIFPYIVDLTDPFIKMYKPPVKEFAIDLISLPVSCKSYSMRIINSASILLVTEGKASVKCKNEENDLCSGTILFISSGVSVSVHPDTEMLMFRAYCQEN